MRLRNRQRVVSSGAEGRAPRSLGARMTTSVYHVVLLSIVGYLVIFAASRLFYFVVLFTHIPLAGLMGPFIVAAVWFALRGRFDLHTRLTRVLWPVWMYVSVTGVIIYVMLYVL